jgi:hypothetical protein
VRKANSDLVAQFQFELVVSNKKRGRCPRFSPEQRPR